MIRVESLTKGYGGSMVLQGIDLEISAGEIVTLVGPSGCGKTTLLRLIAGFEKPDSGKIFIAEAEVSSPSKMMVPHRRGLSMIFQDLALWPHMTVEEHLRFVMKKKRRPSSIMASETTQYIHDVSLNGHAKRYPHQLSGGEKQRLAIARAIAAKPSCLLMDEPFSNLDPILKTELQDLILGLKKKFNLGILYVSHNMDEVHQLADRIAVMRNGKLTQIDTKENIMIRPKNEWVSRLLGIT